MPFRKNRGPLPGCTRFGEYFPRIQEECRKERMAGFQLFNAMKWKLGRLCCCLVEARGLRCNEMEVLGTFCLCLGVRV